MTILRALISHPDVLSSNWQSFRHRLVLSFLFQLVVLILMFQFG